jgi:hypothetical protein
MFAISPTTTSPVTPKNDEKCFPARIRSEEAAAILGFAVHDIPVLVRQKLLIPLGKPNQNSVKYFALSDVYGKAMDRKWLNQATEAVASRWKTRNEGRRKEASLSLTKN